MNSNVIEKLNEALKQNKKVAYVTITNATGSSPARVGNTMLVYEDGSFIGTCGGGNVEYTIIKKAVQCIKQNESLAFNYTLDKLKMVCGGEVGGFIDVMRNDKNLVIVGGGHIGNKLYNIAQELDFNITIVDDRYEYANKDKYPNAKTYDGNFNEVLPHVNIDEAYVVIVTRGHSTDFEATKSLIQRDCKYLGLIGSRNKVSKILKDLETDGIYYKDHENFYAPIGLDIARNEPGEIAISILSEILIIMNNGKLKHMRD